MHKDDRDFLIFLIVIALIVIAGFTLIIINGLRENKSNSDEFCVNNGFVGSSMLSFNSHAGYCWDSKNNKRYFGWNGTEWRFENEYR